MQVEGSRIDAAPNNENQDPHQDISNFGIVNNDQYNSDEDPVPEVGDYHQEYDDQDTEVIKPTAQLQYGLEDIKSHGEGGICVICFTFEPDAVYLPCGHGGIGIISNLRDLLRMWNGYLG